MTDKAEEITLYYKLGIRNSETYYLVISSSLGGIALFETADLPTECSNLTLKDKPRPTPLQPLVTIPLMGSSYELLFAIVDAIVNRSLQRDFSFENDRYAFYLRIIFNLLVPQLNMNYAFKYDKDNGHLPRNGDTAALDVNGFIAIKRLLDIDDSKKSAGQKQAFLKIQTLEDVDKQLEAALEDYFSEDSDDESYERSDSSTDDAETLPTLNATLTNIRKAAAIARVKEDQHRINHFIDDRMQAMEEGRYLEVTKAGRVSINGEALQTLFVIPGFRGVNHMPLRFSSAMRRYRRTREFQAQLTKTPYHSEAVLMSRFDFYRDEDGLKKHLMSDPEDENRSALERNADILAQAMLAQNNDDYILVTGLSNGSVQDVRLFANSLYFLQHLYSTGIIKSQRYLREALNEDMNFWALPNAYNPFVSESETPEHAARYSFGQKNLYEHAALHAHYAANGKPSFPYLGEIYLSLRGMGVYAGPHRRHQLRKLEKYHRVNPGTYIGPEMESTGVAYLPGGEVVFSEVVKCPNFNGRWKKSYLEKFGLTRACFNHFKVRVKSCQHKQALVAFEKDIVEHLIAHFNQCLLHKALQYAGDKILIFLDSEGKLTVNYPIRDMSRDNDANAQQTRQKIERALRKKVVKTKEPIVTVNLTKQTMKVYRINAEQVLTTINQLKMEGNTAHNEADVDEYGSFYSFDEALRTPLSSRAITPRSSSSRRSTTSPYTFSGSPQTPLGDHPYTKSKQKRSRSTRRNLFGDHPDAPKSAGGVDYRQQIAMLANRSAELESRALSEEARQEYNLLQGSFQQIVFSYCELAEIDCDSNNDCQYIQRLVNRLYELMRLESMNVHQQGESRWLQVTLAHLNDLYQQWTVQFANTNADTQVSGQSEAAATTATGSSTTTRLVNSMRPSGQVTTTTVSAGPTDSDQEQIQLNYVLDLSTTGQPSQGTAHSDAANADFSDPYGENSEDEDFDSEASDSQSSGFSPRA